jgi:hypothetical protein
VAEDRGATPAQVALAWLLERPAVTSVIIGARTSDQLADNLGPAADLALLGPHLAGRLSGSPSIGLDGSVKVHGPDRSGSLGPVPGRRPSKEWVPCSSGDWVALAIRARS